jgi:hypothetical protein
MFRKMYRFKESELFHLIHDNLYQKMQFKVFAYEMDDLNNISMNGMNGNLVH